MATHYIENGAGGSQYYFDANSSSSATSQTQRSGQDRSYPAAVTASGAVGSSEYSPYPAGVAGARSQPHQQQQSRNPYHEDEGQQWAQQQHHQSVAGFSKTAPQQQYQSSPAAPQVRATVRAIHTQDQQQQQQQQYGSASQYQQQPSPAARSPQSYANYEPSNSPSSTPQTSQYYHDPRQQSNQSSNYYPTSTSDQRTDSPTRGREQHVQVIK